MSDGLDSINIFAQMGDIKEVNYRNTLAIATIIELLCEKNIINKHEFYKLAHKLDTMSTEDLKTLRSVENL